MSAEDDKKEKKMKVHVQGPRAQVVVNISAYDRLTAKSAVAAADIAFGPASHCDVASGDKQYRVTGQGAKRRARRVR